MGFIHRINYMVLYEPKKRIDTGTGIIGGVLCTTALHFLIQSSIK